VVQYRVDRHTFFSPAFGVNATQNGSTSAVSDDLIDRIDWFGVLCY
jgi:hypothetical protein